jgi:transposase InsO family protein
VRYRFIHDHQRELPVKKMCQVLKVSRSGYYDWIERVPSERHERRRQLLVQIERAHRQSKGRYGSPRVWAQLNAQGVKVCENTVAKAMQRAGIRSKPRRRFIPRTTDSTHEHPIAPNRLDRNFDAYRSTINAAWCVDVTCIWTERQGWLYLAAVMDLCSRRIVGWALADHAKAQLCIDALSMALEQRRPAKGMLHHSDRGVQYACDAYQQLLEDHGVVRSMSRTGNCYDNAAMESFFATLKRECVYNEHYATHEQARASIFEYIEVFYNRKRLHSSLGYVSPETFEAGLN